MMPRGAVLILMIVWQMSAGPVSGLAQEADGAIVVEEPRILISAQQFDQLVFGSSALAHFGRQDAEDALSNELKLIDHICALTDRQRRKLQLAGRGDIKTNFERVDSLRERTSGKSFTVAERSAIVREMQSLGFRLQKGQFDDGSLFRKTLHNTLTDEQLAKYSAMERDQRLTMVELVVSQWGQSTNGVNLSASVRKRLAELLIERSRPPKSWGQYTHYIVLLQIAELEDEVRPMLDEAQWELISKQLVQARRVEPQLRQMGIWPPAAPTDVDDAKE